MQHSLRLIRTEHFLKQFIHSGTLAIILCANADARWVPGFDLVSNQVNPLSRVTIYSLATSPSGELFIGGEFEAHRPGTSPIAARHLARWDGTNWNTVGSGINGPVRSLLTVGSDLYAGGSFTVAGGTAATNIARWDGTNWWPVGHGLFGRSVNALLWKKGILFAGGSFTNTGDRALRQIAAWDGTNWQSVGSGFESSSGAEVAALLDLGGDLVAGGSFTAAGGISATNIARFDGSQWNSLGDGVPFRVFAATTNPAGQLFVAGGNTATGPPAINQWDGAEWRNLYTGGFRANRAARVLFWEDGHLYTEAAHLYGTLLSEMTGLARLDETGWTHVEGPFYPIQAGPASFQGRLAFAGTANTPVTPSIPYVASWDLKNWQPIGAGAIGTIETFVSDGTEIIAAGRFNSFMFGSRDARLLARWNGRTWKQMSDSFRTAENQTIRIRALAAIPGRIVTTLPFSDVVVSIEGTNLVTLGTEFPDTIQTLAFAQSNLYAGGSFGIRAWNGSEWNDLGGGINGTVLAIFGNPNSLYVGGSFNVAGGVTASNIAHWNGVAWSALGDGVDSNVWAVAGNPSGSGIFIGGDFQATGTKALNGVAEWSGTQWISLSSGISLGSEPGRVRALALNSEGQLYMGGQFDKAGNTPATNIAVWKDGNWIALDHGITGTIVNSMTLQNGDIYVGGDFYRSGTAGAHSIALWRVEQQIASLAIESFNNTIKVRLLSASDAMIESTAQLGPAAQWNPHPKGQTELVITNLTIDAAQFFRATTATPFR